MPNIPSGRPVLASERLSGLARAFSPGRRLGAVAFITLCLTLLSLASTHEVAAQEADVRFGDLTATANFPDEIAFTFAAAAPTDITRVELLFNAVGEETLHLITPDISPGEEVAFDFGLDMYQNYYPPGLDVEYRWRVTDAVGDTAESETVTLGWYDTRYEWEQTSTDQVMVYTYDTDDSFAAEILASAQSTIDDLQTEFGVDRSEPLRIWVYDSQEDLGGATERNSEPWIAGVSYPGSYLILAAVPDGDSIELRRVIPHEVSHQVLYQATENPFNLPATWIDEGLATYNQDIGIEALIVLLEEAVDSDSLMPIASLNTSFPYDESFRLAYAQSYSVVSFIIQTFGKEPLGNVLDAYQEGVSHEEAVQRGLGVSIDKLDAQWRASLDDSGNGAGGGFTQDGGWWANGVLALVLLIAVPTMAVRYWRNRGTSFPESTEGLPV